MKIMVRRRIRRERDASLREEKRLTCVLFVRLNRRLSR
jgi:hypothetical protein